MNNTTYYQRNREVILNKAKDYYKINKQKLREQAKDYNENDKKEVNIKTYLKMIKNGYT